MTIIVVEINDYKLKIRPFFMDLVTFNASTIFNPMTMKEDEGVDVGMKSLDESISCTWDCRGVLSISIETWEGGVVFLKIECNVLEIITTRQMPSLESDNTRPQSSAGSNSTLATLGFGSSMCQTH